MKSFCFILSILFVLLSISFCSSQNLVNNPSFEDTVYCPNGTTQITASVGWLSFGLSPDYFNACATNGVNVPYSVFGYQDAHTGNGRAGLLTWRFSGSPTGPNSREFIGTELSNLLNIGTKYYFSCYINFSNSPFVAVASNKFGMKLSTVLYDSSQYLSLVDNQPLIFSDSIVTDSVSWLKINGSFIADSAYKYLIVGNFFDDSTTDTIGYGVYPNSAYYYLDDICLSTDSIYCDIWTNIENPSNYSSLISIYPNPTKYKVNVNSANVINSIDLINTTGQILKSFNNISSFAFEIPFEDLRYGIYYLRINTQSYICYKIIIKN